MPNILATLAGFCGGFLSSAPLGPINLMLADMVLQQQRNFRIFVFLLGVILTDMAYATAAAWGYAQWLDNSPYIFEIQVISGLFLIGLGGFSLFKLKNNTPEAIHHISQQSLIKDLFLGVFLCGSNPSFVMFWLFAIDSIKQVFQLRIQGLFLGLFLVGIFLGDAVWFSMMAKLAKKGKDHFSDQGLKKIRFCIALGFIALGGLVIIGASSQLYGAL